MPRATKQSLTSVGLFAGIGGIELGLSNTGYRPLMMCEIDAAAAQVLSRHFHLPIDPDIRKLREFPRADVVAAGFPCQDLSQAGRTAGIVGAQSKLVAEVFKRLGPRARAPRWLLLENVPFMLQLQRGRAMKYLVEQLEALGFTWAYRVIDARAFGIPQRRRRVLLVASRTDDPRGVLLGMDAGESATSFSGDEMCGFYWTEGSRGLGWAIDAVPTLKGGSGWGIPSPPAIWDPRDGSISTPHLSDAERLQGFEAGWTKPALDVPGVRSTHRWKLVGNAVSVPVSEWLGQRLVSSDGVVGAGTAFDTAAGWPNAAWGHKGRAYAVDVSSFPVRRKMRGLRDFLRFPTVPLSHRAASGFLARARMSSLKFEVGFLDDVARHMKGMRQVRTAA